MRRLKNNVADGCKPHSYWFDSTPLMNIAAQLHGRIVADICIIGGGITGLSTAYHLARLDPTLNIVVLEAQTVGAGASGRNAGQAIVALGNNDFGAQLRRHGAANLAEAYTYVADGIALLAQLCEEEGIDCDWQPTGYFEVGLSADGEGPINAYRDFLCAIGQDENLEVVPEAQVLHELKSPLLGKALFDRRGGQFNPLKLVHGLRSAAASRGVIVHENSPVWRITKSKQDIVLHTEHGSVSCGRVVLATNGYTHLLRDLGRIKRVQSPLFVYANVTEPLAPEIWRQLHWPRRCGVNIMSDMFFSFAPTADGRILYVGGYNAHAATGTSMAYDQSSAFRRDGPSQVAAFFPPLHSVRTTHSWGGAISVTADFVPHVGVSDDPRIFYAAGCWGHGVPIGLNNGRTLAELALGRESNRTRSWLAGRKKSFWPNRPVAAHAMNLMFAFQRRALRQKGRATVPRITFSN